MKEQDRIVAIRAMYGRILAVRHQYENGYRPDLLCTIVRGPLEISPWTTDGEFMSEEEERQISTQIRSSKDEVWNACVKYTESALRRQRNSVDEHALSGTDASDVEDDEAGKNKSPC